MQIEIDDKTDRLLALLSVIPPPEIVDAQDDFFRTNENLISKLTSIELVLIGFLIILFFLMIFKHFRYDWLSSPKYSVPPLTSLEILMLMGKNIKRLCKNFVPLDLDSFF